MHYVDIQRLREIENGVDYALQAGHLPPSDDLEIVNMLFVGQLRIAPHDSGPAYTILERIHRRLAHNPPTDEQDYEPVFWW